MKKINCTVFAVSLMTIAALGGCGFLIGPDSPVANGGGNLSISLGAAGNSGAQRTVVSGADLSAQVLAALRYELTLTGPGGEVVTRTVRSGENLSLTVVLGNWRIDAAAYLQDGLAGTGTQSFTVVQGDNSVLVPMTINRGYFDIVIGPSISNGTVSADFAAAFPGTTVTLTVTPDPGYALKDKSLKYNDGSDHVIAGPPYTFTMPASDLTISAVFNPSFGITVEGPQDETVTVTATHSAGHDPVTDISWSAGESVTFTVDSPDYTAAAGNLKWFVSGREKTGTGNSLTVNARDYVKRKHSLTVMIKLNGQWYSTDISFAVVD
jgi:hypothetical protein